MRNILFLPQISSFLINEDYLMKIWPEQKSKQFPHCILGGCYKKLKATPAPCSDLWSHSSKGYNRFVFINVYQPFLTKIHHNYSLSEGTSSLNILKSELQKAMLDNAMPLK